MLMFGTSAPVFRQESIQPIDQNPVDHLLRVKRPVAARAMRQILVDSARQHQRVQPAALLDVGICGDLSTALGTTRLVIHHSRRVLEVHEALECLSQINPRQARLVELRYFGGLTKLEAAEVLGVSIPTVELDWQVARLWLHRRRLHLAALHRP